MLATFGAGAPWSPRRLFANGEQGALYLPHPSYVYQSNDTSTAGAVGQTVGYITDLSGRGNHATQASASRRPVLRQTVGGLYYLEFDGTDDYLATGAFTSMSQPSTVFTAHIATGSGKQIFDSNGSPRDLIQVGATPTMFAGSLVSGNADAGWSGAARVYTATFNGASSTIGTNATATATINAGSNAMASPLLLGIGNGLVSPVFAGSIYAFIFLNRLATASEQASVQRYLAQGIGL